MTFLCVPSVSWRPGDHIQEALITYFMTQNALTCLRQNYQYYNGESQIHRSQSDRWLILLGQTGTFGPCTPIGSSDPL